MESKTKRTPRVRSKFWISRLVGSIFVYNVVLSVLALCLLATIWPSSGANQSASQSLPAETFRTFILSATISGEVIVILIVMLMGALGALVYTSTALVGHVAHDGKAADPDKWKDSYTLWYLVHPLLGASVAVIFYMVLRGGVGQSLCRNRRSQSLRCRRYIRDGRSMLQGSNTEAKGPVQDTFRGHAVPPGKNTTQLTISTSGPSPQVALVVYGMDTYRNRFQENSFRHRALLNKIGRPRVPNACSRSPLLCQELIEFTHEQG